MGVSSRGEGDIKEDFVTGEAIVDPDTYTLNAFDLVLIPSVESARLNMITEGVGGNENIALKKALRESLDKASAGDKAIMEATLKDLKIDFKDRTLTEDSNVPKGTAHTEEGTATSTVDNVKVDELIKSLQESLKQTQSLQKQVKMLQEKLSVCNAKETKLTTSLQRSSSENKLLKENLKLLSSKVSELKTKLSESEQQVTEKDKLVESQQRRIDLLNRRCDSHIEKQKVLTESIQKSEKSSALVEKLQKDVNDKDKEISSLNEALVECRQDLAIKDKELNQKVTKAKKVVENYKKLANSAVNKYIDNRAKVMGIKASELRQRLGENFSIDDIDSVCEELANTKLKMSELPIEFKNPRKITIVESKEPLIKQSESE